MQSSGSIPTLSVLRRPDRQSVFAGGGCSAHCVTACATVGRLRHSAYELHVRAADKLRRLVDACVIGFGGVSRWEVSIQTLTYGPVGGPSRAALRQAEAWPAYRLAMAPFTSETVKPGGSVMPRSETDASPSFCGSMIVIEAAVDDGCANARASDEHPVATIASAAGMPSDGAKAIAAPSVGDVENGSSHRRAVA